MPRGSSSLDSRVKSGQTFKGWSNIANSS